MADPATVPWRDNLLEDTAAIHAALATFKRIAVLGIKTEKQADQAAYYVPKYLQEVGYDVVPVPVYYPDVTEILGRPVTRKLAEIAGGVDMVNVFRRPVDIPQHVDDLLALAPRMVWMQLGISHPQVAETLARAGILVVQNRCVLVEDRAMRRARG